MKNVVLAVIGSKGQVSIDFAASLNRTAALAKEKDVHIHFDYVDELTSGMSTALQKNIIANRVLTSNTIDSLFFINPNLSWLPDDFFSLIEYTGDGIVSGAYVDSFKEIESYAIGLSDYDDVRADEIKKADFFSMGFVYIPKKVLQGLTQFVEKLGGKGESFYIFFKEYVKDNLVFQEDNYFCHMVKTSGFDLLVNPNINCTNNSRISLKTSYQDYLKRAWIGKMGEQENEDIPQN